MTVSATRMNSVNYFMDDVVHPYDYYATPYSGGIVWGSGAARLGLTAGRRIKPLQYANVMRGFSPDGCERLVRTGGRYKRRPGWDITFTVDQSLSTYFAVAPRGIQRQIERCLFRAVRKTLNFLDQNAGETRRGRLGTEHEPVGLTFVSFLHTTSRPVTGREFPDPTLHVHCLLVNLARRMDGSSGTLDSNRIFDHLGAASRLFNVELAEQLAQQVGLLLERTDTGFRIAGVPKPADEYFSARRAEMLEYAGGQLTSPGAATAAAIKTRRNKQPLPPREQLSNYWAAICKEKFRFGREEAEALANQPPAWHDKPAVLAAALQRALERITEREASFAPRDLVKHVAEETVVLGVGERDVRHAVMQALAKSPTIKLLGVKDSDIRFTTPAMLEHEKDLFAVAQKIHSGRRHAARADVIQAAIDRERTGTTTNGETFTFKLSEEQAQALRHLAGTSDLTLGCGLAGTGKTTMLAALKEVCDAERKNVLGLAQHGTAVQELFQDSGIKSDTVAMFLTVAQDGAPHPWLDQRTTVVVDESAKLGTIEMRAILTHAERAGAKVVLMGDHRQLQSISAGSPFRALAEQLGAAQLQQITRQRDPQDRQLVRDTLNGHAQKVLKSLAKRERLVVKPTRPETHAALVDDLVAQGGLDNPKGHLIIAHTRREVAQLNRLVQAAAHARHADANAPKLKGAEIEIAVQDRVQFTKRSRPQGIENGDLGTVKAIDVERSQITVELDRHNPQSKQPIVRTVSVPECGSNLQLGWATTNHKAQSQTREQTYVLLGGSGMLDRHATYVALSRARGATRVYTDELTAGEKLSALAHHMARERPKAMAHDVRPQASEPVDNSSLEAFAPSAKPRPFVLLQQSGPGALVQRVIAVCESQRDAEREQRQRSELAGPRICVSEWVSHEVPKVGLLAHSAHGFAAPTRQELVDTQGVIIQRGLLRDRIHSVHPSLAEATRQMQQIVAERPKILRNFRPLVVRSRLPGEELSPGKNLPNVEQISLTKQQPVRTSLRPNLEIK